MLQSSGVTVKQECVAVFTDIKLGHKYRYVVYALTEDLKQIHVLKTAPPSKCIHQRSVIQRIHGAIVAATRRSDRK